MFSVPAVILSMAQKHGRYRAAAALEAVSIGNRALVAEAAASVK